MENGVRVITHEEMEKLFPTIEQRTMMSDSEVRQITHEEFAVLAQKELEFWRDFRRLTLLKKKAGDINSILTHILHECERLEKKVEEGLEKYDVELKIKGVENE